MGHTNDEAEILVQKPKLNAPIQSSGRTKQVAQKLLSAFGLPIFRTETHGNVNVFDDDLPHQNSINRKKDKLSMRWGPNELTCVRGKHWFLSFLYSLLRPFSLLNLLCGTITLVLRI